MRWRLAALAIAVLALGAACSTKWIKFPAEEYLAAHWKERLILQDETYPARRKCQAVRAVLLAPGTGVPVVMPTPPKIEELRVKCEQLEARLADLGARDLWTIRASLKGDTVDKESIENIRSITGPLLGLALDIMKGAAL